jgi:hypothetical protein
MMILSKSKMDKGKLPAVKLCTMKPMPKFMDTGCTVVHTKLSNGPSKDGRGCSDVGG